MGKSRWMIRWVVLALVCAAASVPGMAEEPSGKGKLSILYAGHPGGPRERAWMGFLKKWFERVEAISLKELDARAAAGFDVVVADWTRRYENGRYNPEAAKHGKSLGEDFTRPIIMISAVGAELTRAMNLKTDWL